MKADFNNATVNNESISINDCKTSHNMKLNKTDDSSVPISSYKELLEYENKFRSVYNLAPALIWMSGIDMSYNFFNKEWTDFTGRNSQEEMNSEWQQGIHTEDLSKYQDIYTNSFQARKHFYIEFRLKRHDGEYRWLAVRGEPRYSAEGIFEGFVGSCTEMHEQKFNSSLLEQKIQDRTKVLHETIAKLEQSNLELTQFAYVATHDLQEPLRKIKIFTDRLLLKAASKLKEDELSYLNKIKTSTARMSDLIKDVLEYSVLSSSHDSFIKTDLNQIIQNVLTDFELLIIQKKASIEVDKLPSIEALPLQMNQLFNNLISNSLKFTAGGIVPSIKIKQLPVTVSEKKELNLNMDMAYIKISFSDNGIGFSTEYNKKIFEIFQRLNGIEYPGTGIGLALCKKIIHNHQGEIFAESAEGNGAAFHIIMPLTQYKRSLS